MMAQIEEQLKEEKALGNNCRAVGTRRSCLSPGPKPQPRSRKSNWFDESRSLILKRLSK